MTDAPAPIAAGMVLAAGLGTRMRPLTLSIPKPLIPILGRTMLDRALDALIAAGVTRLVVNSHHLPDKIEAHLRARPFPPGVSPTMSREATILDTGGGIARALPYLGEGAFFVANGDVCWKDGPVPALRRLAAAWNPDAMDALLLLHSVADAIGYDGAGDFDRDTDGRLQWRGDRATAPYVFAGVQILHPRLFRDAPDGAFPLIRLFRAAEARGRLFGIVHDGLWCHVGTPPDISAAEAFLADRDGAAS